MGASRRQAAWVIAATVVITAGTLIYIFATVPPRSQAISDAVRDAAGATVTATVTVTETFVPPPALVEIPAPVETPAAVPAPVEPAPVPAAPEVVNPDRSATSLVGAPVRNSQVPAPNDEKKSAVN